MAPGSLPCGGEAERLVARVERRDGATDLSADDAAGDVDDAIHGEAELREDRARRRRGPEMIDPDDRPLVADPALPAERGARLDADTLPHRRRQDGVSVGLVLDLELLPARQGDDARRDPLGLEDLGGPEGELELGPRADQDQLGRRRPTPRAARSRPRMTPSRASSSVPASVGSFWRVSASADRPGPGAIGQAPTPRPPRWRRRAG